MNYKLISIANNSRCQLIKWNCNQSFAYDYNTKAHRIVTSWEMKLFLDIGCVVRNRRWGFDISDSTWPGLAFGVNPFDLVKSEFDLLLKF